MIERHIVALGGGGFSMEPENPLLDDFIVGLSGAEIPRVCFVPTASGDADGYLLKFYQSFSQRSCTPSHLALFRRDVRDLRRFLLDQDVIYVGGGNTANLLAIWRAHGVDHILREAWEAGIVLCGLSAGSLCWFEGGITDSFGEGLQRLDDGLGFLSGSHSPHYDGESARRPAYHEAIASGLLPGIAADDGAALHFVDDRLNDVVTSRPDAAAYEVRMADERVAETRLEAHYLGPEPTS